MRSRSLVWGRRLLVGTAVVGAGGYGAFHSWVRSYDPGVAGPERNVRVLVDDDGQLRDEALRMSSFRIALRWVQLAIIYLPLILSYPLTSIHPSLYRCWQEWFLVAVQWSGPAFIKLAQWLATRRDLFDSEFRALLGRLFDHVDPHSYEFTLNTIKSEIGNPSEIFEFIDEEPVGSGSIAQVHRAKLKENGQLVAIKVCHPHVRERIALDFAVLNGLAAAVEWLVPSLSWMLLPKMALSWTAHLAQQIDLRIEAENLDFFLENFKGTDTQRFATFPQPIRPYVSALVLVEEFVEGRTLTDSYIETLPQDLRTHLAGVGMDTYMKFLLRDNWLHGDLHPGNILVADKVEDGKKWPVVYLVDCGLCQHLLQEEVETAHMVLSGFAKWEDRTLAESLWRMGQDGHQREGLCKESFHKTVLDVFDYYQPCKGSDACIVGRLLEAMFDSVRIHKLQLEPQYTSLLFGALIQENFIMTLDSNFNIIKRVIPWLAAQGITSEGMFKNYTGIFYNKGEDKKADLGPEMEKKGLLRVEGGNHRSFEEERQEGGIKEEWNRGILEAKH
eukprot:Rhum_TRINITY_DN14829_c5_g1::Rhum_TRINITY_DN14829_c5_g1_i1::g.121872::m.121872/K08869/ADCK, ABC1; aarF domain-containing kinase